MENFLVLVVLIIIIGAFLVKYAELFGALLAVVKWLAVPLLIAGSIWGLSKLGPWLIGA